MSSPVALLSAGVVVVAAVAFVATGRDAAPPDRVSVVDSTPTTSSPSVTPSTRPVTRPTAKATAKKPRQPVVRRGETYVEVYNNSEVSGLAGTTAARAQGAGWQVVGSDNWYGTIPASTVYYPERLKAQAALLGKDLGVERLRPAIAPMRFDRLTVILTTDYSG